jgi:hypothetical protein
MCRVGGRVTSKRICVTRLIRTDNELEVNNPLVKENRGFAQQSERFDASTTKDGGEDYKNIKKMRNNWERMRQQPLHGRKAKGRGELEQTMLKTRGISPTTLRCQISLSEGIDNNGGERAEE